LCHYGGARWKIGTREEMYCKNLPDLPTKNYPLYNVYSTNIMAYFNLQQLVPIGFNWKILAENNVNKEKHFVKAIVNGIL